MDASRSGWTRRERVMMGVCAGSLALSIAAVLGLGGAVSVAGSGEQVTSDEIAKGAVRSSDVRNNTLGAADVDVYTVTAGPVGLANGETRTLVAGCNENDEVVSGGGVVAGGQDGMQLTGSQPGFDNAGNDAWATTASNYSGASAPFLAQAICLD